MTSLTARHAVKSHLSEGSCTVCVKRRSGHTIRCSSVRQIRDVYIFQLTSRRASRFCLLGYGLSLCSLHARRISVTSRFSLSAHLGVISTSRESGTRLTGGVCGGRSLDARVGVYTLHSTERGSVSWGEVNLSTGKVRETTSYNIAGVRGVNSRTSDGAAMREEKGESPLTTGIFTRSASPYPGTASSRRAGAAVPTPCRATSRARGSRSTAGSSRGAATASRPPRSGAP